MKLLEEIVAMKTTIISAVLTPLDSEESLHVKGLELHLEEQIVAGISGILAGGTMGLVQHLRDETYLQLIKESARATSGRAELLVGVGDLSFVRTRDRISVAQQCDIDGVVVVDPYFIPYNQKELVDYYETLADMSRVPVYLYYLPGRTGTQMSIDTVVTLSKHPNIRGIKCAVDFAWTRQLMHQLDDSFRIIVAQVMQTDLLIRAGVREHLDGLYALFPSWTMRLVEAAKRGDWILAAEHQAVLSEFAREVLTKYPIWSACTAILNARGVPGNMAPRPMQQLLPQQSEELLNNPLVRQMQQSTTA